MLRQFFLVRRIYTCYTLTLTQMVTVAQLVESRIVIPVVVGSSPISHPKFSNKNSSLAQPCANRIGYIRTEKEKLEFSLRTIPTFRILIQLPYQS